jgi:hypothetical protein
MPGAVARLFCRRSVAVIATEERFVVFLHQSTMTTTT